MSPISVIQIWGQKNPWERNGKAERRNIRESQTKGGGKYLGSVEIKLFNIKAGKVLQNLVQSSPFMGGKTSKVDTLLM